MELDSVDHGWLRWQEQLSAIPHVYTLFDRIFTGRDVRVFMVPEGVYPAWTDGTNIFFGPTAIKDLTLESVAALSGLNLHEVGHLLYTPRVRSDLVKLIRAEDLWDAFNQLEDQRVEAILVSRYPSTAAMFRVMMGRYLLNDLSADQEDYYPLLAGRWYLSPDLRSRFRLRCPQADDVDRIVTAFRASDLSDVYNTLRLVREWNAVRGDFPGSLSPSTLGINHGRPVQAKIGAEDAQRPEVEEPGNDSGTRTVRQLWQDEIAQALAEPGVREDLQTQQRKLVKGGGFKSNVEGLDISYEESSPRLTLTAHRFARELRDELTESDPGWLLREPSGRVNLQRIMRGVEPDEAFDRWEEGGTGLDLEAVVLLDQSGSMVGGPVRAAAEAGWVIMRALRANEFGASMYTFHTDLHQVYGPTDTVGGRVNYFRALGGTDAAPGLKEALSIMHASARTSKLVIILTDGEWNTPTSPELLIKKLQRAGVLVAVAYLPCKWNPTEHPEEQGHGSDVFTVLEDAGRLVPFAKKIVLALARAARH